MINVSTNLKNKFANITWKGLRKRFIRVPASLLNCSPYICMYKGQLCTNICL